MDEKSVQMENWPNFIKWRHICLSNFKLHIYGKTPKYFVSEALNNHNNQFDQMVTGATDHYDAKNYNIHLL